MDREIRILLVGKTCTGKSSLGNLLLGERRFKVHRNGATKESQLERSRLFDGTELVIVDTPGYENLHRSREETDMELMRGMGLLKPGPHFIIAVKSLMERVTGTDVEWLKQFQERYGQYMQNIIPVFTGIDALEDTELDKYIEDSPSELQQMLKATGDHPLIGGRSNKDDRKLVEDILARIKTCYKPDNYISLEVEAATPGPPREHFGRIQKSCMMDTLESPRWDQPSNHRNIILLGKSGIGKSSVGNILLDKKVFQTSLREDKGTKRCQIQLKDELTVVDTPGYFSSLRSDTDTAQDIAKTLQLTKLPIHVFMLVLSADTRFTGDEKESLDFIKRLFGEKLVHNMIIVFTGKDQLEEFDNKFKAPNCLPSEHQLLINGKKVNTEVRNMILTEILKPRYEKAVDVPNIDKNTLSTIWTTENERKMGSKRRVEELSNTYRSHFNQHSKRRTGELSPTPNPPNGNSHLHSSHQKQGNGKSRPLPLPKQKPKGGHDQPSTQRNIILLGKSGIGKSSVGNILLDEKAFQTSLREDKGTKKCDKRSKDDLTVVDTPGYFSSLRSDTDTAQDIIKTLQLNKLPIHVFMLVLSAEPRFTGDEKESLDFIKRLFGENVVHNMIIVFTGKDQLEDFDTKFKAPNCLPSEHQLLINGKKVNTDVRKEILAEILNPRYEKAVDVPNIDKNTLSTIWTTENERKKRSKQLVEELSSTYHSHLNQHSETRTDELSLTPYSPNRNRPVRKRGNSKCRKCTCL